MIVKFVFILSFIITTNLFSQTIKPHLIGIVVSDVEKATKWYEKALEIKLFKEMSFPEYDSLKINFLKGKHFQLELMEKKTSFSIEKYVSNYSLNDKPLVGFSKVAFSVQNISTIYERLKKMNATEILGITEDKEFNTKYFIIKDFDGNIIQFIEQLSD